MRHLRVFTALAIALIIGMNLQAQDKFGLKFKPYHRDDSGFGYNFFMGDDAEDFQTTIKGFGSGFLFDVFTSRQSLDLLQLGAESVNISLGLGFALNKYRFKDNLVISLADGGDMVSYEIDPDPDHDYVNTFFGYGKSKVVTGSFFIPAHLNITVAGFMLSAGGFADFYVFGKHKRKFLDDGDKVKELVKPAEFKNYNLNKFKYGVSASITHKKTGIGLSGAYYMTPFFQEGMGPQLNEARVSLFFSSNPKLINR